MTLNSLINTLNTNIRVLAERLDMSLADVQLLIMSARREADHPDFKVYTTVLTARW